MHRLAKILLLAVGVLFASAAWQRAEAHWPWDDDLLFGEWALPCQYRSPPVIGCRKHRRCKRVGNRWLCSRWMERKQSGAMPRKKRKGKARYPHRGRHHAR